MSVSSDYLAYVIDQLASFATVVSRRMFGCVGLYADGLFFALIDDDTLYFKVDASNRDEYIVRGCKRFEPFGPDSKPVSLGYYTVPAEVLEDPDELARWARKSVRVAAAAGAAKKKPRARKTAKISRRSR